MSNSTRALKLALAALSLGGCGFGGGGDFAGKNARPAVAPTEVTTPARDADAVAKAPATTLPAVTTPPTTAPESPVTTVDDGPAPDDPTKTAFQRDVLPILTAKCAECHHAGSPHTSFASFPFNGGDMTAYVQTLLAAVKPGASRMPPGARDPLTAAEVDVLAKWAADGLAR